MNFDRHAFSRHPLAGPSLVVLMALALLAVLADVVAPYDPNAQDLLRSAEGPSAEHLLGTDRLGRDILTRLIYGGRVSLTVGIASVLVAAAAGLPLGIVAGYLGGRVDRIITWAMDFLLSFPRIVLAILIVTALGQGLPNMILAIGIWAIPHFARVARASCLATSRSEYVMAARSIGLSDARIVVQHVFPNSLGPLIVLFALTVGAAVLAESGLSFLGLGVPPGTPAWGLMMADGRTIMRSAPHIITFPGLAIVLTVLALNLVGDAVREALDPTLSRRQ